MSMTGLTTNGLLPIGQGSDSVSIFDINVLAEKIDSLIYELQNKDELSAEDITEINSTIQTLSSTLNSLSQSVTLNTTNLQNVSTLLSNLETSFQNLEETMIPFKESMETMKVTLTSDYVNDIYLTKVGDVKHLSIRGDVIKAMESGTTYTIGELTNSDYIPKVTFREYKTTYTNGTNKREGRFLITGDGLIQYTPYGTSNAVGNTFYAELTFI